jgi:hypothetical protein
MELEVTFDVAWDTARWQNCRWSALAVFAYGEPRDIALAIRAIESTIQCISVDSIYWFSNRGPYWGDPIVGNGGFSLRSRKLYKALVDLRPKRRLEEWAGDPRIHMPDCSGNPIPEDMLISIWYRDALESRYEIKFCPPELATKFSAECVHPYPSIGLDEASASTTHIWLRTISSNYSYTIRAYLFGVKPP